MVAIACDRGRDQWSGVNDHIVSGPSQDRGRDLLVDLLGTVRRPALDNADEAESTSGEVRAR